MATTSAEALVAFGEKHVNKGLPKLTQDVFDKGEGSWVTMKSGKKLLDLISDPFSSEASRLLTVAFSRITKPEH